MSRRLFCAGLWCAVAAWGYVVLGISSLSPRDLPEVASLFSDKFNHFAAFAVGGWLTASVLRLSRPAARVAGRLVLAIALLAAFGALGEALQMFIPGRTGGDVYDWIADFLGAVAGALLTIPTHARLERFIARP